MGLEAIASAVSIGDEDSPTTLAGLRTVRE
jgi:hypothetical protein